jgi:ribosomal protein S27E
MDIIRRTNMIKVLNKDVEQTFYRQKCEDCHAELEFAFDDTYEGALGARYLKCPVCGREVITELEGTKLSSNNIKFPLHFFEPGGVDCSNDEINTWIRQCLKAAEESDEPYGYFATMGTGNTRVILMAYEDEYNIVVTKDYYETSVNREKL